ncbi:MAG: hypothetical protein PHF86_07460 [Candidatus Nanoarchaeia archaeon]|jgi:hypothetical protein|nr:hypothetical protein [Candidatus Nanoarchaeia archaeon]
MLFISNFFSINNSSKKLKNAQDVLELYADLKAYRFEKEVAIVESSKNKIIKYIKNTFPSNPVRATSEINKFLCLNKNSKSIWTCGFRDNEERWVWYEDSKPKITVCFNEAYKNGTLEDKVYFYSARYGMDIISRIKKYNINKIAKEINGFILEKPYIKLTCNNCKNEENYTIDDLVDSNKNSNYNSNNVVCQHCNKLIILK